MSCACGCGSNGQGQRPSWNQTSNPGMVSNACPSGNGGGIMAQPDRAPVMGRGGRGLPWWLWILGALLAYQLLKGGT